MAESTLAERISASFAAWECRGRGWTLADYPVALEPPYRSFFLLPLSGSAVAPIDDGRRSTLFGVLFEKVSAALGGGKDLADSGTPAFEEALPFPAFEREGVAVRRVLVPADFVANPDVAAQLILGLTSGFHPVSFEVIGHAGRVAVQVAASEADAERVFAHIGDYVPEATVGTDNDLLESAWNGETFVVDFGLSQEFFLPLHVEGSFRIDPYIPLVTALARAGRSETVCLQVLFERTRNPWREAILDAVTAPDGKSLFIDAPEFVALAREKTERPLFAAVVRVASCAETPERARDLARGTHAFFSQFVRPGGNEFIPLDNDGYDDARHARAIIERESLRTGMILSLDELLELVHLPDASVRQSALARVQMRSKALPEVARGHRLVIGENAHRGVRERATLGVSERLAHTVMVGASGTGKSTLLLSLIRQDIERGEGVAVLDPHGDLIEEILAHVPEGRRGDVVVFDPADESSPVGFNVLHASTDIEKTLLASDLVSIFRRLSTSWGDTMNTVLSNAVLAILESPRGGTLLTLRRFLVDEAYRREYLETIRDEQVRFFWRKEWPMIGPRSIGPILTRLDAFLRPKLIRHVVAQKEPRLDLGSVMNGGTVFLGKLSQGLIGADNAYLLGSLLLSKFLQLALSRQGVSKGERRPFWIYLDEAEHFVTPTLAALLTEARKYGVGLHLAFQTLAQLRAVPQVESAVLGNAHTRIAFRVGDDDARKLAEGFSFFDANDVRNLRRGEAIARIGEATNDFNLTTVPVEAIDEDRAVPNQEEVKARSRARFGVPLAEIANEMEEPRQEAERPAAKKNDDQERVERPSRLEPRTADIPIPREEKPARVRKVSPPDVPALGRGGPEHKYLQHLIKRFGEERGFRAVIEEVVPDGRIDVALRRSDVSVACEISITTGVDQELGNVRKCLQAGFAHVWLVVPDEKRREKAGTALKAADGMDSVMCLGPDNLVAAFEALAPRPTTTERTVGGYNVKVTRRVLSYDDMEKRQSTIAEVIARSVLKGRK